jgi:ATP citrate (pro-S)-lyase
MPISEVFEREIGIGGVLSILWFKRQLPVYATKFIEMAIIVTADHGPAVSGAHNTIVAARAGKDLISSIASGMLTIGPRFGGAIDGAAQMFSGAFDRGLTPLQFVDEMKKKGINIQGIGHRIKSVHNPDMRVTIMKEYAKKHFKATSILDFALEVEKITTAKKDNLILNVDGCIGICFVDMLRSEISKKEADEYVALGALNGLFVLGRTIGMIAHFLDQNRLGQGLYRHPWDDITYMTG